MSIPPPRPLYLMGGADPIFAVFHPVAERCPVETAVLISPPFGFDDLCSYRSRRTWAQHLAAAGYPTLRIDLPGTGDSGGSPFDPARLQVWVEAAGAAADWLRATSGCRQLAAIGIGLGGIVLCAAIAAGVAVDALVLWATPARGRTFVRELRAFGSLGDARLAREELPQAELEPGAIAAGGFALSRETIEALGRFDAAGPPDPDRGPCRVLLLGRDGVGVDERLRAHLERSGVDVAVAPGHGFGAMMGPPHDAKPPVGVMELVQSWLHEGSTAAAEQPAAKIDAESDSSTGRAPALHEAARHGGRPPQIELVVGTAVIREIPVQIALPFGDIFGVISEPVSLPASDLCAALLNAGMIHRVGPGRLWVDIARGWAARGVPTLRLDFDGIGDSDDEGSPRSELADLYDPEIASQLSAGLDMLTARGHGPRVVLGGLCAGAYWAFHGALQDERVTAAFMLNPARLFWDELLATRRELRKGLLEPSHWRKLARGELAPARALAFARRLPRDLVSFLGSAPSMRRFSRSQHDQLEVAFERLSAANVSVLLAFSGGEPLHDELVRQGRLDAIMSHSNVRLATLPGHDHTLNPIAAQRGARALLDEAISG